MGNQQSRQLKQRGFKQSTKETSGTSSDESPTELSFRYVGGRTFRRDIPYMFPVDEREAMRLEKQQIVAKLTWQGNFSLPIDDHLKAGGLKILDVGCGPGIWITEMAETYPLCTFTGVDVSPVYPLKELPENVEFIQADILNGLPIEDSEFDFVVMHFLSDCFTIRQWKSIVIQEVARVMKPGAWLEWMESGSTLKNEGENTKKLRQSLYSAANSRGVSPWTVNEIPKMLDNSGIFVNIRVGKRTVIFSSAGGKCGELFTDVAISTYQALKKQTMEFMSITPHEYDLLLYKIREEFEQYQTSAEYYRFCSQKIVIDIEEIDGEE
ncbi:725_t:CDS:2 [Ambispora gerdemannii]|uniref:725_t:CDS:1 n=1 Tax=Ambispora gerdemannii TaxID=144530 RepID=A0A9N9BFD9_9GLOM|nr:725_t:CDS:2 [Ambispora gerdemannii]